MTEKPKRDPVTPEMRQRLLANRDGRLTPAQWGELIAQPLFMLILLCGMGIAALGTRMMLLLRFWWLIIPLILLIIVTPMIFRAYRFARAPVRFTRLNAGVQPLRVFGKTLHFYIPNSETASETNGKLVKFSSRLTSRLPLVADVEYLIYYLDEPNGRVLLSAAPTDHEDADLWMPTKNFEIRQERRSGEHRAARG